jgi:hypothetical protein
VDRRQSEGRLRRRALVVAAVMVGLGVAALLTGWYREAATPLLVIGIGYAVAVLVMDRRRPRP